MEWAPPPWCFWVYIAWRVWHIAAHAKLCNPKKKKKDSNSNSKNTPAHTHQISYRFWHFSILPVFLFLKQNKKIDFENVTNFQNDGFFPQKNMKIFCWKKQAINNYHLQYSNLHFKISVFFIGNTDFRHWILRAWFCFFNFKFAFFFSIDCLTNLYKGLVFWFSYLLHASDVFVAFFLLMIMVIASKHVISFLSWLNVFVSLISFQWNGFFFLQKIHFFRKDILCGNSTDTI